MMNRKQLGKKVWGLIGVISFVGLFMGCSTEMLDAMTQAAVANQSTQMSSQNTQPSTNRWYRIQVKHSNQYLDVRGGSTDANAPVDQSPYTTALDGAAQLWQLIPAGGGWYRIQVKHSNQYLDVRGGSTANNAPVDQSPYTTALDGAAQLWQLIPVEGEWYRIQVKHSNQYLDVTGGSTAANASVGQSPYTTALDGAAQLWRFIPE